MQIESKKPWLRRQGFLFGVGSLFYWLTQLSLSLLRHDFAMHMSDDLNGFTETLCTSINASLHFFFRFQNAHAGRMAALFFGFFVRHMKHGKVIDDITKSSK